MVQLSKIQSNPISKLIKVLVGHMYIRRNSKSRATRHLSALSARLFFILWLFLVLDFIKKKVLTKRETVLNRGLLHTCLLNEGLVPERPSKWYDKSHNIHKSETIFHFSILTFCHNRVLTLSYISGDSLHWNWMPLAPC